MRSSVVHSVVCCEEVGRFLVVMIEILQELDHLLDPTIHAGNICQVFCRMRAVGVAMRVQAEEVEEKDNLVPAKCRVKVLVGLC